MASPKQDNWVARGAGLTTPRVIKDVVSQHAEEASFLWLLRNLAIYHPHYSVTDLTKLDNRVEAHLDGLRISGPEGWEILRSTLFFDEPSDLFAAGSVAFASENSDWVNFVLSRVEKNKELSPGVASALGWMPLERARSRINLLVASDSPILRTIGLSALAMHRADPGAILNQTITSPDVHLRARALRAVGELGRIDLLPRN